MPPGPGLFSLIHFCEASRHLLAKSRCKLPHICLRTYEAFGVSKHCDTKPTFGGLVLIIRFKNSIISSEFLISGQGVGHKSLGHKSLYCLAMIFL